MARYVVGTVDEIPPGGRKIVQVGGRSVGVFNVGGEFFALLNRCPHQAGPLCRGRLSGFLRSAAPGEYLYSRPGEVLRCPWHGWEFDIRTGQSWFDPAQVRVRQYQVAVAPGAALESGSEPPLPAVEQTPRPSIEDARRAERVEDARPAAPEDGAGMAGLEKGPYVAETFPVSVEREYVVVEVGG